MWIGKPPGISNRTRDERACAHGSMIRGARLEKVCTSTKKTRASNVPCCTLFPDFNVAGWFVGPEGGSKFARSFAKSGKVGDSVTVQNSIRQAQSKQEDLGRADKERGSSIDSVIARRQAERGRAIFAREE